MSDIYTECPKCGGDFPYCPKCSLASGVTGPHPVSCTAEHRFWHKVRIVTHGCWAWTGAHTTHNYGSVAARSYPEKYAHRLAWHYTNGPIPDGMDVLHRCDNPTCVRPAHLFLGTAKDNAFDMLSKGRGSKYRTPRHTHCCNGHAFDAENTYTDKDGNRSCRACRRKPRGRGPCLASRGRRVA